MVDYSEIRHTSPSTAFFFTHLEAQLDSSSDQLGALSNCSSDQRLQIGDFVLGDSSLGLVLGNLYPLLRQSLAWFKFVHGVLRRESIESEVRSSGLETSLSSSASMAGAETNTAVSMPSSIPSSSCPSVSATPRTFHALKEGCSLKLASSLKKPRFVSLGKEKRPVPSLMVRFVFMRLRSCVASDFLSTHS